MTDSPEEKPAVMRADSRSREYAMDSLLQSIRSQASEYRDRAARLTEWHDLVKKELEEKGIDVFRDSSFLSNVHREMIDATRQTHHHGMVNAFGFASTVVHGRP